MALIKHQFVAGQRWENENFILYILGVNDDLPDESGTLRPGKICVTEEEPFPGKKVIATDLHPINMQEVIDKGKYTLMDEPWTVEFAKQAEIVKTAAAATQKPQPTPPPMHGLGAMLQSR